MWKRLQSNRAPRQPQIGNPTLVETTLDEQAYSDFFNSNVGPSYDREPVGRKAQPRALTRGIPSLPLSPNSPPAIQDLPFRPASSVYSQPSPNPQITQFPRDLDVVSVATPTTTYTGDISPPSSPEIGLAQQSYPYRGDTVSPIQEDPEPLYTHNTSSNKTPSSSIPVLRREKRRNQFEDTATNLMARNRQEVHGDARRVKTAPKYDPYTGEPTTSERGKPQHVKPSAFSPGDAPIRGFGQRGMGTTTYITSTVPKPQTSFSERVRRLKESNLMTVNRPEWKGASGRQTVVRPVAEIQPTAPPVPARSPSRRHSPPNGSSGHKIPASIISSDHFDTSNVSLTMKGPTPSLSPPIPARDSRRSPSPNVLSQISQVDLKNPMSLPPSTYQPYKSPANSDRRLGDQYNTPAAALTVDRKEFQAPTKENLPSGSGVKRVESIERSFRDALKEVGAFEQPVSRFSVTTYATSTASSTPRASIDIPPVPTPPIQQFSILNRKRPQIGPIGTIETAKATSRKAVGSGKSVSMSISSSHNSKSLPKTPGEVQSVDLIGSLQAQLDNLAQRKQNLQKSIHQMTELMPADVGIRNSVVVHRRDQEKKKVETLKEDLADVQAQEHELGLKLHRAWKRRDQDSVYEPTGLWVRRVTG